MGKLVRDQSGGTESLTMMLVSKIAKQEDVDPINLSPPINTIIDIDALAKLLFDGTDGFVEVEFMYSGHQITIGGEEELQVEIE